MYSLKHYLVYVHDENAIKSKLDQFLYSKHYYKIVPMTCAILIKFECDPLIMEVIIIESQNISIPLLQGNT